MIPESSYIGIANALFGFLTVLATSTIGLLMFKAKARVEERLAAIKETSDKTLIHVNDAYTVLLGEVAKYARLVADGPNATDADKERASRAEAVFHENLRQQEAMKDKK